VGESFMRILHVTHQYLPAIGGSERYITDISEELVQRGHTVDVFTSQAINYQTWQNVLPRHEVIGGVTVHRFHSFQRRTLTWKLLRFALNNYDFQRLRPRLLEPLIFYGNGPCSPALFQAIARNGAQYDLIHINQLHYAHAYTAHLATRFCSVPIVTTPHLHMDQPQTFAPRYMQTVLKKSDAIFAVSAAEQRFIQAQGFNQEVVLAGNGLRMDRFPDYSTSDARQALGLSQDAFVFLFLGRKTEYKGLETTLNAFNALQQVHSEIVLLAFGPETEYSTQLWAKLGKMPGVIRRGAVSDEERLAALAACDVLVMPSSAEAFGIVFLEAWAYRKAVIAPRIDAVASWIEDGVDGCLVAPGQVNELRQSMNQLYNDRSLVQALGMRGHHKLLARYTVAKITDIVEATCIRVLRRHRSKE